MNAFFSQQLAVKLSTREMPDLCFIQQLAVKLSTNQAFPLFESESTQTTELNFTASVGLGSFINLNLGLNWDVNF